MQGQVTYVPRDGELDSLKTQAVLFDLGGTLLVMRRDRIFGKVLLEHGVAVGLDRIHSAYMKIEPWWLLMYGSRIMTPDETNEAYRDLDAKIYQELFPRSGEEEADSISKAVRARWPEIEKDVPPELYPDAEPTLSRLAAEGYRMGLVSNAPPDTAKVIDALRLDRFLSSVVISGIVGYTKPHPEIFRIALRELGALPEESIHVGDLYDADVVGARNAGVNGILLDRDGSQGAFSCIKIGSLSEIHSYLS